MGKIKPAEGLFPGKMAGLAIRLETVAQSFLNVLTGNRSSPIRIVVESVSGTLILARAEHQNGIAMTAMVLGE